MGVEGTCVNCGDSIVIRDGGWRHVLSGERTGPFSEFCLVDSWKSYHPQEPFDVETISIAAPVPQ